MTSLYGKLKKMIRKKKPDTSQDYSILTDTTTPPATFDISNSNDPDYDSDDDSVTSDDFNKDLAENIGLQNLVEPTNPGVANLNFPTLPQSIFHSAIFANLSDRKSIFLDPQDTHKHRLNLAADYFNDALHSRDLQVLETTPQQKLFQKIYKRQKTIVAFVVLSHMVLSLWQDPSNSCRDEQWIQILETCFLIFYLVDIAVGIFAFRINRYLTMRWNAAYVVACFCMFIECMLGFMGVVCTNWTRPMLALLLICRVSSLRHTGERRQEYCDESPSSSSSSYSLRPCCLVRTHLFYT